MANIKISELNPLLTVEDADVLPIVDNGVTKKVTAAILQSYTQGNSVLLTGAQTIAGIKTFTSQLASTVATGTAPFSVASTTKVTNLNADLLDGLSSADFQATLSGTGIVKSTAGTISYLTDNTANWDSAYNDSIVSAAVTGTTTKTLTLNQQDGGSVTASWTDDNTDAVTSVFGRTGAVVATEGDYSLTQLSDVTLTSPSNGQVLKYNGTAWVNGTDLNSGTVTSVGMTVPTGLSVSGSPITTSGTLAVSMASGYSLPTDASQATWNTAYNERISTLTTTGSSGAATLSSNTLNIPNYTLSGLGGVPYTGATTNVDLGTHSLTASDLVINHASGSGVAASITKGGNGEALTVVKSSGSGNAASITGGTTLISELHLTTDLADAYIASAATWNAKQNAITLTTTGTSGAATLVGSTLNIPNYGSALANYLPLAGGTLTGALNGTRISLNNTGTAARLQVKGVDAEPLAYFYNNTGTAGQVPGVYIEAGTNASDYALSVNSSAGTSYFKVRGDGAATFSSQVGIGALTNGRLGVRGTTNDSSAYAFEAANSSGSTLFLVRNDGIATFNNGTANQNTKISGSQISMSRTSDGAEVVYFSKNTDLGADGTANIQGYNGIQFRTQGAESVKATITEAGLFGIGTTSPQEKLQVQGNLRFTGADIITANTLISEINSYAGSANQFKTTSIKLFTGTYVDQGFMTFNTSISGSDVERMRIAESGNVGIGTTSPTRTLSVNGQIGLTDDLISTNSTNVARFGYNAYYASSGFNLTTENSIALTFGTASAERMRITSGGSILINKTTNPSDSVYKLIVRNSANVNLAFGIQSGEASIESFNDAANTGNAIRFYGTPLRFFTDGVERLTLATGGNVLIGTSTDSGYKLDVNGTARFSGNVSITKSAGNPAYIEVAGNGNTPGSTSMLYGQDDANNGYLWNRSNAPIYFGINNSIKMTLKANTLNIGSIPTSPVGLSTGDIWSNAGILTIV